MAEIVLADSENDSPAAHAGNPRSQDRLTRMRLCYIRAVDRLNDMNVCHIGFLVRDEMAENWALPPSNVRRGPLLLIHLIGRLFAI